LPIALTLAVAGVLDGAASGAPSLESVPGIHIVTFERPAGSIYVNLPGDLAAGDTASATVNPVPAGASDRDQVRNRQELEGHSVALGAQRAPATERVRTFNVPAGATAIAIVFLDARGRPAGEVSVPIRPPSSAPPGYLVPALGQSGGPVRIAGAFDGDLSDSAVHIGGAPAQPIAESPRQLVVRGPQDGAPPAPIEVSERGRVVATGTYRNVGVRLSAPLTNLLSGQKTTLSVHVSGLEALQETLPVRLTNHSPDVVRMEGGEEQTLCVRPDEVKANGTWTKTRGLTGVRAGGFSIRTEVTQPGPQVEASAPAEVTLRGELLGRLLLNRPARTAAGESLAAGAYQVVVRGAGERGRVRLLLWRDGKAAGAVDGVVSKRASAARICDARDVSDAADRAAAGTGERTFAELGFPDGGAFAVSPDGGGLRVALPSSEGAFSIEARLAIADR
jgi:hypothetical protein